MTAAETPTAADPLFAALDAAAECHRETLAAWAADAEAARRARAEAAALRQQLDAERRRAEKERERARSLRDALRELHRAAFSGNVFELILRASMSLTGATRGLYVAAGPGDSLRARAALDVDGYPRKAPSAFVRALCGRVLANGGEAAVFNDAGDFAALPAPDGPGERFADCLAAPALLHQRFSGVVLLADKPGGFGDDDVETVMCVGEEAGVAARNRELQDELLRAYFSVVGVLADAIEAKDPYTKGHCELVASLARRTATRLGADDALRSVCCYGGLLHDVGKIGVSDGVLNKPGKLLPEEWTLMQSHVRIGKDLLAHVPALGGVASVVLHHHERFDGAGYPDGLRGDAIPLAARVVAVADAYCAMTSKRSYKESSTPEEAREELVRCRGTHFDPRVVDAFLAALDEPNASDDCEDGCGVTPELAAGDFRHALRPGEK